jgi:uncharacterized protein (TIRG00374 family)
VKKFVGIAGILISIAALYFLAQNIDIEASWQKIKMINPLFIVAAMALYITSFYFRALRWQEMWFNFPTADFTSIYKAIVVGFAGNNFIPARGGELLRMEFFNRRTGIDRIVTLSSIFTEKILDGISMLFLLLFGIYLVRGELLEIEWFRSLSISISLVFGIAIAVLIYIRAYGDRFQMILSLSNNKIITLIKSVVHKVYGAIYFMKFDTRTLRIFTYGLLIWLIEAGVFAIIFYAFGITDYIYPMALLCMCIVNFGILVPSSPAYLGVFQGMTILALSLFALPQEKSLSISLVVHFCQFLPISLWGIFILLKSSFYTLKKT